LDKIKDIRLKERQSAGELVSHMGSCGFQATNLGRAVELIGQMKREKCTVFLGFTANLVASGLRGVIAEMCRKRFVDVIVTTAGSIDHDIIKSFHPYFKGAFDVDDTELHKQSINRIGNIFVETTGFEILEEKIQPWLKELHEKEKSTSPSELNRFFGEKLPETSFLHWCAKNSMPVFCPGITDGAIGLQMYFFKQQHPDFGVDVTGDMDKLAGIVLNAEKTSAMILGGGIAKHHIIGANIVRGGLDLALYISTAQEFDGSLSGARTREAKSWGKITEKGKTVQLNCDASIAMPLIAAALREKGLL
jgi:deoxyhypusine synthase